MKTHAFANPPTPVEEGGARKGVPSSRGQTHAAGMRDRRGSEAAFGFESPPPQTFPGSGQLRSSVWLRKSAPQTFPGSGFRWRGPVFEAKMSETNGNKLWKLTSFFLGIQRQRVAAKVQAGEARFGPELDFEKP